MLAAQYDFNAGLDPSSLASLTQAQLLQMIQQMAPLSNIGGVITGVGASLNATIAQGSGSPSVTNNPRFERYIWLNTFTPGASPTVYTYGAGFWRSTPIAAGSVVNASISATAEIEVSKLQDGGANEVVVTAGDGVTVQWSSVNALLTALPDSVPLTAIDDSTATSGAFLRSIAGAIVWSSLATVIAAVQAGLTPVTPSTIITPGANNTFVGMNGAGTVVSDTIDNIAANGAIGLGKLNQGGASAGDILSWNGSSWVKSTPATSITSTAVISTNGVLSTAGGTGNLTQAVHTIAHGLGGIPKNVNAVAVCILGDVGWTAGDEVDIRSFRSSVSNVAGDVCGQDATNVTVLFSAAGTLELANKGTGVYAAITETSWQVKVYAWR